MRENLIFSKKVSVVNQIELSDERNKIIEELGDLLDVGGNYIEIECLEDPF